MRAKTIGRLGTGCLVSVLSLAGIARGQQTYSWSNPAGGDFGETGNWSPAHVPGLLDTAVFSLNSSYSVSSAEFRELAELRFSAGSVNLDTGGVFADSILVSGPAVLQTGESFLGFEQLEISSGAKVVNTGFLFPQNVNAKMTITGPGTRLEEANELFNATITNSAVVSSATFGTSFDGSSTVSDGALINTSFLYGGNLDPLTPSTLHIANGATLSTRTAYLGGSTSKGPTHAKVTVSGPTARWGSEQYLSVGDQGIGTLNIRDGALVQNTLSTGFSTMMIGYLIDPSAGFGTVASGYVEVVGAGSRLINTRGQISIANLNTGTGGMLSGTLSIRDGGFVSSSSISSASQSSGIVGIRSGVGYAEVVGPSSLWQQDGTFTVGPNGGTGHVRVFAGGQIQAATLRLDANGAVDSRSTIVIDGPGSRIDLASIAYIGGTLTVSNSGAINAPTLYVYGQGPNPIRGRLQIADSRVSTNFLTISGGNVVLTAGADSLLNTASLTIVREFVPGDNPLGLLDVGASKILLDYAGSSPRIQMIVHTRTGRNNGDWNGRGISSSLAASDPTHFGVAIVEAADVGITTYGGQPINGNALLIGGALLGDANFDSIVNISDFSLLAANFNRSNMYWARGDFDHSLTVNIADFAMLASNFGRTFPADAGRIPEPAAAIALLLPTFFQRRR